MDSPIGAIPDDLLRSDRRQEAIQFIIKQPWPGYAKREYLFAWARTVGTVLTHAEVSQVENSSPPNEQRE